MNEIIYAALKTKRNPRSREHGFPFVRFASAGEAIAVQALVRNNSPKMDPSVTVRFRGTD
jgi:hypothetical protein